MKVGKAIKRIEGYVEVWDLEQADEEIKMIIFKDDIKAFKIAIKALEKQLSKKIVDKRNIHTSDYNGTCIECGDSDLTTVSGYKYCPYCGQRMLVESEESDDKDTME